MTRYALRLIAITAVLALTSSAGAVVGMVEMLNLSGARQAAMGETPVLSEADPFNLEYNPAAIVGLPKGRIGFTYHSAIQGRDNSSLAIIFPVKGVDCGVHVRLSSLGDIEARGETPTTEPDYLFSAHDFAARAFAAIRLHPRLQAGLSLGWMMEKIDIYRANAPTFGAGLLYDWKYGLMLHASAANIGPAFTFITEDQSQPSIYRAGVGYHRDQLSATADYVNIKSGEGHLHLGGEYLVHKYLFLRGGYQTGYDSRNFSAGAGFIYDQLRIDYAFVPYKSDMGSSHRFTLVFLLK
ncbi:MAG: PorV/PorQ family protein [candidate division Zixibacteria bacterium]|nr:PorV/PorQ family protein [candidate division Zixibacteria bacterium]